MVVLSGTDFKKKYKSCFRKFTFQVRMISKLSKIYRAHFKEVLMRATSLIRSVLYQDLPKRHQYQIIYIIKIVLYILYYNLTSLLAGGLCEDYMP